MTGIFFGKMWLSRKISSLVLFRKKGAGREGQGARGEDQEIRNKNGLAQRRQGAKERRENDGIIKTEDGGLKAEGFYIWLCGLGIFGIVWFWNLYRSFYLTELLIRMISLEMGLGLGLFVCVFNFRPPVHRHLRPGGTKLKIRN